MMWRIQARRKVAVARCSSRMVPRSASMHPSTPAQICCSLAQPTNLVQGHLLKASSGAALR